MYTGSTMAAQQSEAEQSETPVYTPPKVLYTWRAPARAFKKRTREYWVSIFAIAAVTSFILYIIESIISVVLVIAIVFLYYILSTVEPEVIEYQITDKGVRIGDDLTEMSQFSSFWFGTRFGVEVLILQTYVIPGRLELAVNEKDKKDIQKALSKYLPEEEPEKTNMDKASTWLANKLPENK